jgi:hypothetical protein
VKASGAPVKPCSYHYSFKEFVGVSDWWRNYGADEDSNSRVKCSGYDSYGNPSKVCSSSYGLGLFGVSGNQIDKSHYVELDMGSYGGQPAVLHVEGGNICVYGSHTAGGWCSGKTLLYRGPAKDFKYECSHRYVSVKSDDWSPCRIKQVEVDKCAPGHTWA